MSFSIKSNVNQSKYCVLNPDQIGRVFFFNKNVWKDGTVQTVANNVMGIVEVVLPVITRMVNVMEGVMLDGQDYNVIKVVHVLVPSLNHIY